MFALRPLRPLVVAIALAASACATNITPPMERGVYAARGFCYQTPNCVNRYWRAAAPVRVHARVDPRSPVIATVAPGEWVTALDAQFRFLPLRGVVHTATDLDGARLEVGDVVYMLESRGDEVVIWRRGEYLLSNWGEGSASEPITWGPHPRDRRGAIAGWWFFIQLENGQTGWTEGGAFECVATDSRDEGCRG